MAWLVEEPFVPLVANHPAIADVIPVATRRWRRRPLAATTRAEVGAARDRLRSFAPDLVMDPQGLVKSAIWGSLAQAPRRIGFARAHLRERLAGVFYTDRVRPPKSLCHVVDLNLSLLEAVRSAPPYGALPDGRHVIDDTGPRPEQGTITLLPSTGGDGKRWSLAAFAELSRLLRSNGHPVAVAWGPEEEGLARTLVENGGHGVVLAPPTTLPQLACYLAGSAMVVGGDTGPVHLAASLGTPTVAVFVTTDPGRNGPRGELVNVVSAAAAGARRGRARTGSAGTVTVAQVLETVEDLLERGRR